MQLDALDADRLRRLVADEVRSALGEAASPPGPRTVQFKKPVPVSKRRSPGEPNQAPSSGGGGDEASEAELLQRLTAAFAETQRQLVQFLESYAQSSEELLAELEEAASRLTGRTSSSSASSKG